MNRVYLSGLHIQLSCGRAKPNIYTGIRERKNRDGGYEHNKANMRLDMVTTGVFRCTATETLEYKSAAKQTI